MTFDEMMAEAEARLSRTVTRSTTLALKSAKAPNEISFLLNGRRVEVAIDPSGNVEIRRIEKLRMAVQGSYRTLAIGEGAIDEILGGLRWLEAQASAD